jgi:phage terminase large subunit GpA-like protein
VIEYGTWPGQNRQYFTLSDIRLTIDAHYSSLPTWEVRLAAALRDLLTKLFGQQWPREDGLQLSLTAGGVDANWQTDAVKAAVMASGFYGKVYPTHGRSFTTAHQTLNESAVRDRDIVGDNWRLRQPKQGDVQFVTFDTNVFKSQLRDRLMMNIAQPGALTLHLGPSHDMWADHICAERCHEKLDKTRNREYEEWMKLPNLDNHYLDCEVINNVVAGMLGIRLPIGAAALDAVKAIAAMPTSSHSNQNQNQPVPTAANYQPFAKKRK